MLDFSLRVPGLGTALLFSMIFAAQISHAQLEFSNSGQVSAGSPISGILTDAVGDSVGYEVSTVGALFFGFNGDGSSEPGGFQADFSQNTAVEDWIFTVTFDSPIEQLTLSQASLLSSGDNAGGTLAVFSDATSNNVDLGTQGLGADSLSNLSGAFAVNGGDVIATLAPTSNNEADFSIELNDLQSLSILYQPTGTSSADIGLEFFTLSSAIVGPPPVVVAPEVEAAAIPEPSTLLGLGGLLTTFCLRRRRAR